MSLPAYASSLSATRQFIGQINGILKSCPTSEVDSVVELWTALGHEQITTDKRLFQRHWSTAVQKALFRTTKPDASDAGQVYIVTAAQCHSCDWITANQIGKVGTRLVDETQQIGVAI